MNCREVRRWLSPYLDSELGQTKTFEISQHLTVCEACRWRFERERLVDREMSERLQAPAPPMDWNQIEQKATKPHWAQRRWARPAAMAFAMAACVILTVRLVLPGAFVGDQPPQDARWLTDRFAAVAASGLPFVAEGGSSTDLAAAGLAALDALLTLEMPNDPDSPHTFELVNVRHVTTADGQPFVEIKANCCGQPILLLAARQSEGALLSAVAHSLAAREPASTDLRLESRTRGDFVILAVSHHPVDMLVDQLHLVDA